MVLPLLKKQDEIRVSRIKELSEEVVSEEVVSEEVVMEGEKVRRFKGDVREFLTHFKKIRLAERMFRESIITSIVTKFDEFLTDLLKIAYASHPGWLKNPDKKISYKELLEIESLDKLKDAIISK